MRESGILLPLFSLPSPYGIGTLGREAYSFLDFLKTAGQSYWQMLPLGPTSFGDSPYQSFSTFAGNPYFIDLETLVNEGFINTSDCDEITWSGSPEDIDYGTMFEERFTLLRKAFSVGFKSYEKEIEEFRKKEAFWLEDYALFMSLKFHFSNHPWQDWDEGLKLRKEEDMAKAKADFKEDIDFWVFLQYLFFSQWQKLKDYAKKLDIKLIGDVPIYVAGDSADAWANPELFQFDENLLPTQVAGCPPDAFTADGQLWGNPLYRWEVHVETGFDWWIKRLKAANAIFDCVRFDHFRGLEAYYAIPFGHVNAKKGHWEEGPGKVFVDTIKKALPELDIIAEDLGFLTPAVHKLLKQSGFPGMKVLEFAFNANESSDYLPHMYPHNCVVYTGTHDNDTISSWYKSLSRADREFCQNYFMLSRKEGYNWGIIRGAWASCADLAIAQFQDFIGIMGEGRINFPSTLGTNWRWRMPAGVLTNELAMRIYQMTATYRRLPAEPKVPERKSKTKK